MDSINIIGVQNVSFIGLNQHVIINSTISYDSLLAIHNCTNQMISIKYCSVYSNFHITKFLSTEIHNAVNATDKYREYTVEEWCTFDNEH